MKFRIQEILTLASGQPRCRHANHVFLFTETHITIDPDTPNATTLRRVHKLEQKIPSRPAQIRACAICPSCGEVREVFYFRDDSLDNPDTPNPDTPDPSPNNPYWQCRECAPKYRADYRHVNGLHPETLQPVSRMSPLQLFNALTHTLRQERDKFIKLTRRHPKN